MKDSHLHVIDLISESSLKLSQLPELHNYYDDKESSLESYQKVYQTIIYWKQIINLHLELQVNEK